MLTQAEESRLIAQAVSGDRDAAEALVRAHQAPLYGFLLRMCGRSQMAEDVTQEALVRALLNLHRFDARFRFSTWLFTIAKRLMINELQRRKPMTDAEGVLSRSEARSSSGGESASEVELSAKRQRALQRGLMALSVEQRQIVVLFHMQSWPIATIAEHMGMPEGTVKSHLHRARERLRDSVGPLLIETRESREVRA